MRDVAASAPWAESQPDTACKASPLDNDTTPRITSTTIEEERREQGGNSRYNIDLQEARAQSDDTLNILQGLTRADGSLYVVL